MEPYKLDLHQTIRSIVHFYTTDHDFSGKTVAFQSVKAVKQMGEAIPLQSFMSVYILDNYRFPP